MIGVRTAVAWLLALLACDAGPGRAPESDGAVSEAPGMHRESWYGWSLLLPDGCSEFTEERFEGRPIGRARWVCPDTLIMFDATPFADTLQHSAQSRFLAGADLCAALAARDVEDVESLRQREVAVPEVAYYEMLPAQTLAVHRQAADRRATLIVFGRYQGDCTPWARMVHGLRAEGPRLDVPQDQVRGPTLAFPAPAADCHRHYAWPTCKGVPPAEVLPCGEIRAEWVQYEPALIQSIRSETPMSTREPDGTIGGWAYMHETTGATADGPGGPAWRVELPLGEIGVWAPESRAAEALVVIAGLRLAASGS